MNNNLCSHYDDRDECPLCTGPGEMTPDDIETLSRWVVTHPAEWAIQRRFDESQVGGAFDGFSVSSDADGGL